MRESNRKLFEKVQRSAMVETHMTINRREFVVLPSATFAGTLFAASSDVPWQRKVRRVGQVNMTEHDPVSLNVEEWADYWASLKVDAVLVSVTGILAFYQTKVPYHRKGKFLGDRDFFGDCCAAAKKRGLKVIARMSPDLNWEDAVKAHPEWFQRDSEGKVMPHREDTRLFRTCMFTTYMTDYMTAIMREVNSQYDVDALFTNAWPPLGRMPVCYCEQCKRLPQSGTPAYWDKFNERTVYIWKLYDAIAKEKKATNFYFANLGGGIRSTASLKELGELCEWFQCDNQGRGGDDTPIWGCTMQGRVCNAVQEGKMATNVTGAWSTGAIRWRNVHKSPQEAEMWMNETVASGMVPYHHFIGAEKGMGEDRRWLETGRKFFQWTAKHDPHFLNKGTIANLGVVMGQRTQLFYNPPPGVQMSQYMNGMYYALLEGRFLFDFIHEDDLGPQKLKKYSAVLLPNTALLSDANCRALGAYVDGGGSLLATFESSLYRERGERRSDFGLADVFGIRKAGEIIGTTGNAFYARIERQHEILQGFGETNWLPGAEYRVPLAPVEGAPLTVIPGFVAYPPELSYPSESRTNEPAMVVREKGKSRLIYFPGDIERTMWRSGHTDLSRLLQNSIRWVLRGESPVRVQGQGVIETFAWETEPGYAVHLLNYTNPAMHRGWIRDFYPIGEQKVSMRLPAGRRVKKVELLRAGTTVPFSVNGAMVEFSIPKVVDYEVAALYAG
jgi:hypothetical protein